MKPSFFKSAFFRLPEHQQFGYQPRYFDPEAAEQEKKIKFRKGSLYISPDHSLSGKLKPHTFLRGKRNTRSRGLYKLGLLLIMSAIIYLYYADKLHWAIAVVFLLISLVIFIREGNKL